MAALGWRGLYAILDLNTPDDLRPGRLRQRAADLLSARPCCLQLRAKRIGGLAVRDAAGAVLTMARAAGVPFCVNDRVDLALLVGADAVHVGQEDLPLGEVRKILGERRMFVGVSTNNVEQARTAVRGGADYIGFGPVFGTRTKENPDPTVGTAALRDVCAAVGIPVVAIGGVARANVAEVVAAGAAAAAVISDIDQADDPRAAAAAVARAFGVDP